MGGKIWLESEVGRGSTFSFTVRFGSVVTRAAAGNFPQMPAPQIPRQMSGLRILLAEDNPVNQRLAMRLLEKHGHSAIAAASGKEALRLFSEQFFDVILMDVHMPEMDGIEATRAIRALTKNGASRVPIIAITASAMKEDREACIAAGMDGFITKPICPDEFFATLARVTGTSNVTAAKDLLLTA
jgi:CheY-like chemotaxis protein